MADFINQLFGNAFGVDPLDAYLSQYGVTPTSQPASPIPAPAVAPTDIAPVPQTTPPSASGLGQSLYPVANGVDPLAPVDPTSVSSAPVTPSADTGTPPAGNMGSATVSAIPPDNWKPIQPSGFQRAVDRYNGNNYFQQKADLANLKSAMQDFDQNPMRAIRRVAQVSPQMAWNMFNQYHTQQYQDLLRQQQKDGETLSRASGLLAAATPQNYPAIRQKLEDYFQSRGFDPGVDLPENYDANEIQGWRESTMKSKDQMDYESMNDYRNARLEDFRKTIGIDAAYKGARLGQIDREQGEQRRHNTVMEGIADQRTDIQQQRANQGQVRTDIAYDRAHPPMLKTPNGTMVLDPTRSLGKIGNDIWKRTAPGQWTRIHTLKPGEKGYNPSYGN